MSLLRDIQNSAIDENTSIITLLRRCHVLAARLGNEDFSNWVNQELNGYSSQDTLPEYRRTHVQSVG